MVEAAGIHVQVEMNDKGSAWQGAVGDVLGCCVHVLVALNDLTRSGKFAEHLKLTHRAVTLSVGVGEVVVKYLHFSDDLEERPIHFFVSALCVCDGRDDRVNRGGALGHAAVRILGLHLGFHGRGKRCVLIESVGKGFGDIS